MGRNVGLAQNGDFRLLQHLVAGQLGKFGCKVGIPNPGFRSSGILNRYCKRPNRRLKPVLNRPEARA